MHKSFQVNGPVQLDVSLASGEISIDATATDTVDVELVAHDKEGQELVDNARVELRTSGGKQEVVVELPEKRFGFSLNLFSNRGITCSIRCPEGSSLEASSKSADLEVHGTLADASISTASGDTVLEDVTGNLSLKSASGDLTARDVGGRASAASASGDISLGRVGGNLSANSASGDISVEAADGDAKANTASGDVSIDAVQRGDVTVNSASGDVHVGIRRGSRAYLDCSTVSGDTKSELDVSGDEPPGDAPLVQVKARTVSGDITISRAAASAAVTQGVQA